MFPLSTSRRTVCTLKVIFTPLEKVHQGISDGLVLVNIWTKKERGSNRSKQRVFKICVYHQTLDSLTSSRAISHVNDRLNTKVKCVTQESYKHWAITVTICVNAIEEGSSRVVEGFVA